MTVREILEGVDKEITHAKGQVFRLEDMRRRILACAKEEPTPAATPRKRQGVLQLCDETRSTEEMATKEVIRRAA